MHAGNFIGLNRDKNRLVQGDDLLEYFMQDNGIPDPKDVVGPYLDKGFTTLLRQALVKCCLVYIHGSDNPTVCGAARNTNLFEPRGPAMGDIGGALNMPLIEFMARLNPELLPTQPKLPPNGKECEGCGRSFPEPDNFGGVTGLDGKLRCFACYQKNETEVH